MKEFLSVKEIPYVYLDITESMFNLKQFLKYRDSNDIFDDIKLEGRVGLPALIVNHGQEIIFDIIEYFDQKLNE